MFTQPSRLPAALSLLALSCLFSAGPAYAAAPSSVVAPQGYQAEKRAPATAIPTGPAVLLLQDVAPWGSSANETILGSLGVPYTVLGSADLPAIKWLQYRTIVIASDQPQSFYDALAPYMTKINQWVRAGKNTLNFHAADMGWQAGIWNLTLPLGVTHQSPVYDFYNYVYNISSPLVVSVPNPLSGSYASHATLDLGSVPASAITLTGSGNSATLLDYCYGRGRVIADATTLEIAYSSNWFPQLLINELTLAATTPGCP